MLYSESKGISVPNQPSAINDAKAKFDARKILGAFRGRGLPHYVYILHRSDGTPFYVGKGQTHRAFEHENEAANTHRRTHKLNVIRSIWRHGGTVLYSIPAAFKTHEEALAHERRLIAEIGRYDLDHGPLTNQTDGGEGTTNPSEASKERHRQTLAGDGGNDPERALANKFFAEFCEVASTPIKPISSYGPRIDTIHKNRERIGMKPRNSGALVAMAVAQQTPLVPGAIVTRRFTVDGVDLILENGCGRDMLVNGMIELVDDTPGYETIRITPTGLDYILQTHNRHELVSYGVLDE